MHVTLFKNRASQQNTATTGRIGMLWLVKLRWWAIAGQITTFAVCFFFFHISLPITVLTAFVCIEVVSNLFISKHFSSEPSSSTEYLLPITLYGDVVLLTYLFYNSGATMNPFPFLYMVHIALGAMLLRPMMALGLTTFTIICYGTMFLPLFFHSDQHIQQILALSGPNMASQQVAMWCAYSIGAILITFCSSRIQQSFNEYQQTIEKLRKEKIQNEKINALISLAAGAAHELSTPLATIGLASSEMLLNCEGKIYDESLLEDAQLIRDQVERCKKILFQMSADASAVQGEKYCSSTPTELIDNAVSLLGEIPQKIITNNSLSIEKLFVPAHAVSWALKGLLANAADASLPKDKIILECKEKGEYICFTVTDQGKGMPPGIASQAPEPFFTTKPVGKGMGLGLFLAKALAAQLDGTLEIQSQAGVGTIASLSFKKSLVTQTDDTTKDLRNHADHFTCR